MGKFNTSSFPTGGLYRLFGLMKTLGVLSSPEQNKMIVVYDKGVGARRSIYPQYKASRKEYKNNVDITKDKAVQLQKQVAIDMLEKAGFLVLGSDILEADDLMFNIVLHFAYHQEQPLTKGTRITLHSSDADWLGVLGITPNIFFNCTNNNVEKLCAVNSYGDYMRVYGTPIEYHYAWKAVYGDTSDGYTGHRDPRSLNEASKTVTNMNFWNYAYWEDLVRKLHTQDGEEVLNHILLHYRLAMPIYEQNTFNFDYMSKLRGNVLDMDVIRNQLNIYRIKILEGTLGKLNPYTAVEREALDNVKRYFMGEYQDVFDYYSQMVYEPKISTEAVERAFAKTNIVSV